MSSILEESRKSRGSSLFRVTKMKFFIFVIILAGSAYAYSNFYKQDVIETAIAQKEWTVKQDDLKISIEADGQVVAEDGVELSFSVSGNNLEVENVFIKEGDTIQKGDKIATVKTETLELNVTTAYSSYMSALADYNEKIEGATEKELADAQDKITSAEISLNQAEIGIANTKQSSEESIQKAEDAIYDAEQKLEDAEDELDKNRDELTSEDVTDSYENLVDTVKSINISLDSMLKSSDEIVGVDEEEKNDDFESALGAKDSSSLSEAKSSYSKASNALKELDALALFLTLDSSYSEIDNASVQASLTLNEFEKHLYNMKLMLESTITSSDLSQSQLDNFASTVSGNRASVNTRITNLNSKLNAVEDAKDKLDDYVTDVEDAQKDVDDAKRDLVNAQANAERSVQTSEASLTSKELNLEQVKRDYEELIAPLTESEKASARSKLTSASVNFEKVQNELENATIVSPIDGEVANLNYKTGDIIVDNSSSDPVAVIINNETLFIEVNIEEADINKIEVGQKAYVTFDSLDELELEGEISFISLTSSKNNNGIVTYLVRVLITNKGENNIREGMTAFVDFVTAEAVDVLVIPVSAVSNVEDKPSVLNTAGTWIPVTTGFTDGQYVEVISGLNSGDTIVY